MIGADGLATGGVSLAADASNAAITTNPGLLALNRRYDFGAQFGIGPTGGVGWGVSAMDGRTSDYLAMGFVYSGTRIEPPLNTADLPGWSEVGEPIANVNRSHDFAVALGAPILTDRLSAGIGGHLSLYNNDLTGKGMLGNVDAGIGYKPSDRFSFGVSANNIIPWDPLRDRPLRIAGGARVDGPIGALEVDGGYVQSSTLAPGPPVFVASGGELRPGTGRLRAGYRWEGEGTRSIITAGAGVSSGGGSVEYGIDIPIGDGFSGMTHVLGLRFGAPPGINPPE